VHRWAACCAAGCAALLAAWAASGAAAQSQPTPGSPARGRLLYETHCVACHNSQMHWRDQRIVQDWDGLVREVRRWQDRAHLGWSDADVQEVARHLNDIVYRLPRPGVPLAAGPSAALQPLPAAGTPKPAV